jgi:UDP-N-acetylenolpyruvoylglucosamine reductase
VEYSFLADESAVGTVQRNQPLAPLTRYRLGGPAEWFVCPQSLPQLAEVISRCREADVPFRILGGGANLLVDDEGVDGVVVRLDAPSFTGVDWGDDDRAANGSRPNHQPVLVRVGAGFDMARLTLESVRRGLSGLECMAGIPGSVGGCIRMNAGGRWGEIASVVRDVSVVDSSGQVRTVDKEGIGFGYRHTRLNGAVVCAATLELMPGDPDEIARRYKEIWGAKHAGQPLAAHSAGCVFKNPPDDSAGRLIDAAGLKNRAIGNAIVSPEHANFIVAGEGGTARDVLELIGLVRRTVAEKFSVDLELEIEIWARGSTELAEVRGKPLTPGPVCGPASPCSAARLNSPKSVTSLSGMGFTSVIPAGRRPGISEMEFAMTRLARPPSSPSINRPSAHAPAKRDTLRDLAITVLSGGPSSEREVSLKSGRAVAAALESLGHRVTISDITPENVAALDIPADLVFIALHGEFGEDGRVQRILEERGIRYTGSGSAASALSMDKVATKRRFVECEVPTPRFDLVSADRVDHVVETWPLPVVVKPVAEGSSIDIMIVRDARTLRSELQRLTGRYGRCMIEAFVDGFELTVGILGNQALSPIEIRTRREFYNYEAKYVDNDTEYHFDIDLPVSVIAEVQELSVQAHQALGCRHFSRVDWLVDRHTYQPYALEVNTIPGFTDHSLLPKAAARAGLSFPRLCQRIIELTYGEAR